MSRRSGCARDSGLPETDELLLKPSTQQVPRPVSMVAVRGPVLRRSRVCLQEGVKTENDHINLKVAGQDGSVVQFKIKRHTPLSKLMKAYCERQVRPPALWPGLPS